MFHAKCGKKVVQTTLQYFNLHIRANASVSCRNYAKSKLLRTLLPNVEQCRRIVSEPKSPQEDPKNEILLPPLFEQPKLVYPAFFKTLRNQLIINFMLPRLDKDFSLTEFMLGAKQALVVVSNALAQEDYESIRGLVTDNIIQDLQNKISTFTLEQKQLIAVKDEDIFLSFPYEVEIAINKDSEQFAEITVVYHSYRNSRLSTEKLDILGLVPEQRKNIFISNLRFIRLFNKDVESSWTINKMNHFMLLSYV